MKTDCVIVGGGIIGLSVAWELSRRGIGCALVEADRIGRGSSWAGAGILPPANLETAHDPIDQLRGLSHQLHPKWAHQLAEQTGIDPQFRKCGGIYLARTRGEAAALIGQAGYWEQYAIQVERLSIEQLQRREPQLAVQPPHAQVHGAWWVPDEYQMHPAEHLRALRRGCELAGVALYENQPIQQLQQSSGRVTAVVGDDQVWSADQVVLCCGAWASRFADPAGRMRDVFPVRGQVVLYAPRQPLLGCIINEGHRYLVPRKDGRIYVGSSEEEVGWVEGTTPTIVDDLKDWAERLVPGLSEAVVQQTWSGLRPGSFDGFPFLGRSPELENLYLATGHFRSGLHLSCGTAVVIADLIDGGTPAVPIDAFNVARNRSARETE